MRTEFLSMCKKIQMVKIWHYNFSRSHCQLLKFAFRIFYSIAKLMFPDAYVCYQSPPSIHFGIAMVVKLHSS